MGRVQRAHGLPREFARAHGRMRTHKHGRMRARMSVRPHALHVRTCTKLASSSSGASLPCARVVGSSARGSCRPIRADLQTQTMRHRGANACSATAAPTCPWTGPGLLIFIPAGDLAVSAMFVPAIQSLCSLCFRCAASSHAATGSHWSRALRVSRSAAAVRRKVAAAQQKACWVPKRRRPSHVACRCWRSTGALRRGLRAAWRPRRRSPGSTTPARRSPLQWDRRSQTSNPSRLAAGSYCELCGGPRLARQRGLLRPALTPATSAPCRPDHPQGQPSEGQAPQVGSAACQSACGSTLCPHLAAQRPPPLPSRLPHAHTQPAPGSYSKRPT